MARSGAIGRGPTPFPAHPEPALHRFPCTGRKWQWAARQCEASATASGDRPARRPGTARPLPPAAKTAAIGRAQAARSWPEAGRTRQDEAATFQALEQRARKRQRASDCAAGPARIRRILNCRSNLQTSTKIQTQAPGGPPIPRGSSPCGRLRIWNTEPPLMLDRTSCYHSPLVSDNNERSLTQHIIHKAFRANHDEHQTPRRPRRR